MDVQSLGRILLVIGLGIAFVGGLFMLFGRLPINLGNLPGDIRIQRENMSCFFPLGTMLLLSIVLTVVLNLLVRLFNR